MTILLLAILLGIVEGATEFIPVSSTGHLLMVGALVGFDGPPGRVFEVVIQMGAILAICVHYAPKLIRLTVDLPRDPAARRFVTAVLVAFIPAAILGLLLHDFIKQVLFSPYVSAVALVIGGVAILAIERIRPVPRVLSTERITLRHALGVGLCQCLALVPGVSRAGATILGGVMLGIERRAATEFSFFLAIPTMLAASAYDLYSNWHLLAADDAAVLATGFIAAFVSALAIVRVVLWFVGRFGFAPFGWYRIVVGAAALVWLSGR